MRRFRFFCKLGVITYIFILAVGLIPAQRTRNASTAAQNRSPNSFPVHHPVTTSSAQARQLFDQGLTLIYALDYSGAATVFVRAAAIDPNMAMAYWGIAYAVGSDYYYSTAGDPRREARARDALRKASTFDQAPEVERAYIAALSKRYCECDNPDRHQLAVEYKNAMRDLTQKYPDDLDAATLYAQAIMNLSPAGLWNSDGTPVEGTEEIISVLESVLKRNPRHMGAMHYYIHAIEASPEPEKALAYAQVLPFLAPSIGHIVHMPAHIYMRTGDYSAAETACRRAAQIDNGQIQNSPKPEMFTVLSYLHDLYFVAAAASMDGDYPSAQKAATELSSSVSSHVEEMPELQSFLTVQTAVQVRFNRWEDLLKAPQPDANLKIANALWHFGRGMAFAARNKSVEAETERQALTEAVSNASPLENFSMSSHDKVRDILRIASDVLEAKIASAKNERDRAVAQLRDAVAIQDSLLYSEPPSWFYPVRESLGAALFLNRQTSEAEQTFRKDLERNPRNPRSLFGLLQTLRSSGRTYDASFVLSELNASWKGDQQELDLHNF